MAVYGSTRFAPISYKRRICDECHKEFPCPSETSYKIVKGDKTLYFCSWNCFRKVDKPAEEQAKIQFAYECRQADEYLRKAELRRLKVYAKKRLKTAQEKEKFYTQEKRKYKSGTIEYTRARKCFELWRRRRIEATKALEELK